mgnify:CR=1 FL=1
MPLERLLSLNGLSIKDGMVVLAQTQLDIGYVKMVKKLLEKILLKGEELSVLKEGLVY